MIPNVPLRYEQQDSAELGLEVHLRDQNHVLSDMASYYPTFNLTAHTSISGAARPPVLLTTVDFAAPERLRGRMNHKYGGYRSSDELLVEFPDPGQL